MLLETLDIDLHGVTIEWHIYHKKPYKKVLAHISAGQQSVRYLSMRAITDDA